ncbi:MAG TPA: S9 family peptidase, partial [Isosphaeraceae bacterium]|nr:S9 family peptidase [Isosphaeraceae bacterium]
TASVEATARPESRRIAAGTMLVRTGQPLGALAVYLLEPQSDDGLCTWNFFDPELAEGSDFPVVRLVEQAPLLLAPARKLAEDRPAPVPITFEALYRDGPPLNFEGSPTDARWLDDGQHLLQTRAGRLFKVDAATGRGTPFFDPDELAKGLARLPTIDAASARSLAGAGGGGGGRGRGGRRGFGGRFGGGSLDFDPGHKGALFNHENDLYFATLDGTTARRLTSTPDPEEMTSFSPDGRLVAFVRSNDLWVVDLATGTERALTTGGTDLVRNAKADWVYFEEVYNRNSRSYWWSPDSHYLAFLQFDDNPVRTHTVLNDAVGNRRSVEATPYPRSGEPNPRVRLGVVSAAGGPVRWADLDAYLDGEFIITEVGFWPDSQAIYAYIQDRAQRWLDFTRMPVSGGAPRLLFRETTKAWVDNPGPPTFLADGSFLLLSERTGWRHIYHFSEDGKLKKQVTSGEWEVTRIHHADKPAGYVYFSGTRDSAIGSHLYLVKLDASGLERLTESGGSHTISMSPDGRFFIDHATDLKTPTHLALCASDGHLVRTLDTNPVRLIDIYRFGSRELVKIKTADGFTLEGELILPPDLDTSKLYPVWFTTYGGPHAPSVHEAWLRGRTWEQMIAQAGNIVFRADPRSGSGKGAVSTWSAYRRLGIQELKDIEEAIAWLKQKPYVDATRIGMSGHSYGGFMTSFALTHSKVFSAGIAGAPVTDWRDY